MDSYWQETSVDEMQALCGVMIIMGIQYLPQDRLYWDKDEFTGNIGIKKTFSVNRFHKLLEYLHISDRASEAQKMIQTMISWERFIQCLKIFSKGF